MIVLLGLLQEAAPTEFNDLGKLLLVGVIAAIVLAVVLTWVRLKLRDKRPPTANFISINPAANEQSDKVTQHQVVR